MEKDYKSFSSAAKPRFRGMAKALEYEQLTSTFYVKSRGSWYEAFSLQASSYGNDFFYINYGIIVPNLWPPFTDEPDLKSEGYTLHHRLHYNHSQAFSNATKDEIAKSAELALNLYNLQAAPRLNKITTIEHIAEEYFETTNLEQKKLGNHDYGMQLSAANYGLLLRLAGNNSCALDWLQEADRLMALPVFYTNDDRIVHVREKHSRIHKPDRDEIEQHKYIRSTISKIKRVRIC